MSDFELVWYTGRFLSRHFLVILKLRFLVQDSLGHVRNKVSMGWVVIANSSTTVWWDVRPNAKWSSYYHPEVTPTTIYVQHSVKVACTISR